MVGLDADAFPNKVVGSVTAARADTGLVLTALDRPGLRLVLPRRPWTTDPPQRLGQYTALRFTQRLADAGVAPSTGRTVGLSPKCSTDCGASFTGAAPALPPAATGASLLRSVPCRPDDEVVVPCPPYAWIVYRSRGTTSNGQVNAFIEQREDTLNRLLRIA